MVTSSIVWESRGARTLFGRRGVRGPRQRRHQPRGRRSPGHGVRHCAPEGLEHHDEPGHEPPGPGAEAGDRSPGSTSRASTSKTSSSPRCRSPGSRFATAPPRAGSPFGWRPETRTPSRSASSTATGATSIRACSGKIERLLYREDYRRAFGGDIGDIVFPPRSLEFYSAGLERVVDIDRMRTRAFKLVVDYSFGAASIVMPSLLDRLGADVLAVNPFASTSSATSTAEVRDAQVARIAELVRVSGSDLGIRGRPRRRDSRTFVDDAGHVLDGEELLLAIVSLIAEAVPDASVAVPVNVTSAVDESARRARERWCARSSGARASWRPRRLRRWCSRARLTAVASGPTSCPPTTPPSRW